MHLWVHYGPPAKLYTSAEYKILKLTAFHFNIHFIVLIYIYIRKTVSLSAEPNQLVSCSNKL